MSNYVYVCFREFEDGCSEPEEVFYDENLAKEWANNPHNPFATYVRLEL